VRLVHSGKSQRVGGLLAIGKDVLSHRRIHPQFLFVASISPRKKAMDRKKFFDSVRASLFGGHLTFNQVLGLNAILNEWEDRKLVDKRWLAYILATVYHEVGGRMLPVREGFASSDAGARRVVAERKYGVPVGGRVYYGRGLVQLTWYDNYKKMGYLLGIDLVRNPDLALDLRYSVKILFEGMLKGLFTGKRLSDYMGVNVDWVSARQIINRMDKAETIASYAKRFYVALQQASS